MVKGAQATQHTCGHDLCCHVLHASVGCDASAVVEGSGSPLCPAQLLQDLTECVLQSYRMTCSSQTQ